MPEVASSMPRRIASYADSSSISTTGLGDRKIGSESIAATAPMPADRKLTARGCNSRNTEGEDHAVEERLFDCSRGGFTLPAGHLSQKKSRPCVTPRTEECRAAAAPPRKHRGTKDMMNDDLIDDVLDADGAFAQWLDREKSVYLAHAGRDGTLDGFLDHIRKMMERDPTKALARFFDAYLDAFTEASIARGDLIDDR
jgi:hypothetical protein